MVQILDEKMVGSGMFIDGACLSADSKPTDGIVTGSHLVEVDTGIEYLFDSTIAMWLEQTSGKTSLTGATITLGSALTYNGEEQTKSVSSVKVGSTTLVANTDYVVVNNKGTNAGDYTLHVVGIGSYCGVAPKAWSIAKASGSVTAAPDTLSLTEGGEAGESTLTIVGDGVASVSTSDDDIAVASVSEDTVTVTPVGEGSATITVATSATMNYTAGTDTISVTVAAAEAET